MSEAKDRLLAQMKDPEGAVYALISGFTKEPYVECDKEPTMTRYLSICLRMRQRQKQKS
ncbi:hypothetical protein [Clostridium sp. OF09-36]|uniref:hypothetical protein n=1 Tax=Clostridium sp. OF09-36 TaxID=2292310 RepID=UPI0015FC9CED|nr:hypothetical protein [Clostridium sp. OF09-36]